MRLTKKYDHLVWCEQRVYELLVAKQVVFQTLYFMGRHYVIGGCGLDSFSDKLSFSFVAATEDQVSAFHLSTTMATLPSWHLKKAKAIFDTNHARRLTELKHKAMALEAVPVTVSKTDYEHHDPSIPEQVIGRTNNLPV